MSAEDGHERPPGGRTAALRASVPLDVGAARRRAAEARGEYEAPDRPPTATRFVVDGRWRWACVRPGVPEAGQWSRLVARLCGAGPWLAVDVRVAAPGELRDAEDGVTQLRYGPDGEPWCRVLLRADLPDQAASEVLRHELGHVAHLAAVPPASWPALGRHRQFAERVADHLADRHVRPGADVAELLTVAREYRGSCAWCCRTMRAA